nr:response regulator [Sphingopyxis sp. JAI108]
MVVEDDAILRMSAAGMLEDAGYRVFEASCASEALEILRADCGFLAILTDIEMPGSIDGIALAHRIYADWPDIGVIITSGRFQPGSDELPEGAIFIGKPYSRTDILGCVHMLTLPRD